jgi:hypothetical protein
MLTISLRHRAAVEAGPCALVPWLRSMYQAAGQAQGSAARAPQAPLAQSPENRAVSIAGLLRRAQTHPTAKTLTEWVPIPAKCSYKPSRPAPLRRAVSCWGIV